MKSVVSMLTATYTVYRTVRTSNGHGGWSEELQVVGTVRGDLQPLGSSERVVADRPEARVTHVLFCEADQDVQRGDVVEGEGLEVDVVAIREPSQLGEHWEIDCRERQRERGAEES